MKGKGDRRREARRQKSKNLQRCMVFALVSATALIAAIQLTMFTSPGDQPSDAGADLGSRNLKGSEAHSMEYNMEYPEVLETAPAVDLTPPRGRKARPARRFCAAANLRTAAAFWVCARRPLGARSVPNQKAQDHRNLWPGLLGV